MLLFEWYIVQSVYKVTIMRLLVSHREEYIQMGGLSHYLIIAEVMYALYTETSNIKPLMLLVVCTLLKIHINKSFALV